MQSESSSINLPSQYQPYQIGGAIILAVYMGIYVMVSNNYIFKHKIEHFFVQSSIQSRAIQQFLIDVLTNLSQLTFLITTLLLNNSDSSLSVMIYSDISWSGLLLSILSFRGIIYKQQGNWKLMLQKNVLFLITIYITIEIHYITQNYQITLGVVLALLYIINTFIEAHQQRFAAIMEYLFNYQPSQALENVDQDRNNLEQPQYLAKYFPVSNEELNNKMKSYSNQIRNIKIKTRALVTQKLLKIALTVHLSKQKLESKAKKDIKNYYGTFNGTVIEKSKRLVFQKKTTNKTQKEYSSAGQEINDQTIQFNSCIFYIFPVKIFESNKFISVVFSIVINLGFGMVLSIALYITESMKYGQYFQLIYGFLLLPLLPNVSKTQFFNSMTLSSLWKYCLYGIILMINCLLNGSSTFNLSISHTLSFCPIVQMFAIFLITYYVLADNSAQYRIIFIWLVVIFVNAILIFKEC